MLGNLICWDLTSQLPDHFALCLLWSVQNFKMIVLWMKEISWDLSLIWISERYHINGLVQERRNSIANTLELVFLALMHWYSVTSELCIAGLLWGNPLDPSPPQKKKIYIYISSSWLDCLSDFSLMRKSWSTVSWPWLLFYMVICIKTDPL